MKFTLAWEGAPPEARRLEANGEWVPAAAETALADGLLTLTCEGPVTFRRPLALRLKRR